MTVSPKVETFVAKRGRKPAADSPRAYLTNDELSKEMLACRACGVRSSDRLAAMFLLIVDGVQRKYKYVDTDDKYDCRMTALTEMLENWHKFDPTKSDNPFSYMTTVCVNGLTHGWNALKSKQTYSYSNLNFNS